ncbi:MAG TPA: SDR family NAD(P)-dependent oxidoreductase [Thermoanaerobaculia bacterium]|nr:SDR family NAD(P)-dependent oxidoreductase [Thermoanaerobaculia bacterium]
MSDSIAIVGAACRYPDATSPRELWENVLARRQAFRRIPSERLPLEDYYSSDPNMPDRTYSQTAAVITNWAFDRSKYRVSRSTFESADLAHWLALEIADLALQDAGFMPPQGATGVIVGNTLTGDSSRAASLRLRWPYVRRAAIEAGIDGEALKRLEQTFNEPFAPIGEDSLAGGLSNTIAGRICNYFGFNGGGYTVDGACSSSLLSVIHACNALVNGDLDVALAGGVDLSLDPFELIGFAKCTALARDRMWVYDKKANGFLPGEGCGFVVLMRTEDAIAQGRTIHAKLLGWGMSSDGHGGMTRPESRGQRLALQRAYARAGIGIDSVTLFEGHGTGTPVGDPIEIETITSLLGDANQHPRFIGSVKANVGHTKAAAGMAGLLKAMMAVREGIVPPITGCTEPRDTGTLSVTQSPLPWPENAPRRAAVSAMGFGGINTHVVLEADERAERRTGFSPSGRAEARPTFFLGASSAQELRAQLDAIAERAPEMSFAELTDLAASLRPTASTYRAALVASTPEELRTAAVSAAVQAASRRLKIAYLFSGQGSIPNVTTDVAQPAIVRASLERLNELRGLGIVAHCAIGHSLGELTALHWSGALDEQQLLDLATYRGQTMQQLAGDGAMAALSCNEASAKALLEGAAVIAATNGPEQTVISGPAPSVERTMERAKSRGIGATRVPVNAAFHSPMMQPAATALRDYVRTLAPKPAGSGVCSTVTGTWLTSGTDLPELLAEQLTAPVRFREAVDRIAQEADLLIEVGPGRVLTSLASYAAVPVVSSDRIEDAIAAAWTAGADVNIDAFFDNRYAKPFDLNVRPTYIVSPTERGRVWTAAAAPPLSKPAAEPPVSAAAPRTLKAAAGAAAVQGSLRELVATHVDLSLDLVLPTSKLLSDLHLSSITVARLLADAARAMGVPPLADPMSFANATIEEATAALEALRGTEAPAAETRFAEGVENWLRAFRIDDVPVPAPARNRKAKGSQWRILGDWPEAEQRFASVNGKGIVAVLPKDDPDACIALLLQTRDIKDGERLVVVQQAPCGSGFARTLHSERPNVSVRIVNTDDLEAVVTEAEAIGDFCEATYQNGERTEPRVRVQNVGRASARPLDATDTLLVTGGGKGIGFETALAFARETGAKLILLGRSKDDEELRLNLARLDAANIHYEYVAADVTQPLPRQFESVTAILHAAGTNSPALLDALDEASFKKATAPKLDGLANILDAVAQDKLKLLVTFGSVIARTGMRGEAHYAFANEWLARRTKEFGEQHPHCKAICIEYSVWSGMGMGERLGTMDMLRRQGITPIAPDAATRLALDLAAAPNVGRAEARPTFALMACGRLGDPPTIRFDAEAPPLLRFLEQPKVHIAGVELIADSELSLRNDPYLADHAFGGEPLFPAVVGMEAMAQVARAATGALPSRIDQLELLHPVTQSMLRIASVVEDDSVRLAVRTSATQFSLDHFRARISTAPRRERPRIDIPKGNVELEPGDVYGPLLFHTGRFQRVRRYRLLTSTQCVAELTPASDAPFHRYQPQELLLGDLTIRDAAIHALQASVPHQTVLPAGIASVELFAPVEGEAIVVAHEVERHATHFVWNVDIASPDGLLFERWTGLRLQVVASRERVDDLAPALWGPYLERQLGVRTEVGPHALDRVAGPVLRRKDGKPLVEGGHVSASHDAGIGLAVRHETPVGCDVQYVDGDDWDDVLGHHDAPLADVCMQLSGDEEPFAAARVWSARESLKKLAGDPLVPLVIDATGDHRRVTFRSGNSRIDTFVLRDCVVAVARN